MPNLGKRVFWVKRIARTAPIPIRPETIAPRGPAIPYTLLYSATCRFEDKTTSEATEHWSKVIFLACESIKSSYINSLFAKTI